MQPLQALAKWRRVYMNWQLGQRSKGDPEADAVVNHYEMSIIMRAELNALTGLLIQKGVFTALEFTAQLDVEAEQLSAAYAEKFPGFRSEEYGIAIDTAKAQPTFAALDYWRKTK